MKFRENQTFKNILCKKLSGNEISWKHILKNICYNQSGNEIIP